MQWFPKLFRKDNTTCFICNNAFTDVGAEVQYSYNNNGKKALDKILICTACADELEVTTSDLKRE